MASPPSRTTLDFGLMIRSTLALSLLALAFWAVSQFLTKNPDADKREVDYQSAVESARRHAEFPVLAPAELPDRWRATSAGLEPDGRWSMGALTADEEYLGIDQSNASVPSVAERLAGGSQTAGSTPVANRVWQVRVGPERRLTYLVREQGVTTAVTGTTSKAQLEKYIESLTTE